MRKLSSSEKPDLFAGPKLKIERAESHIGDYRMAFKAFAEAKLLEGIPQCNIQTRKIELFFPPIGPHPAVNKLRIIAADALYNLRSALDQVACCAVPPGKSPQKTYFPHGKDEAGFKSSLNRVCKKVPERVRDEIANLEPYYGGKGYLLRVLHDLNVIDKHTSLLDVEIAVSRVQGIVTRHPGPIGGENGKGVSEIDSTEFYDHHHIEITTLVTFAQIDAIKGESATQVLMQLRDAVRETVAIVEAATQS